MSQVIKEKLMGILVIGTTLLLILPSFLIPITIEPEYELPTIPQKPDLFDKMEKERNQRPIYYDKRSDVVSIAQQVKTDQDNYASASYLDSNEQISSIKTSEEPQMVPSPVEQLYSDKETQVSDNKFNDDQTDLWWDKIKETDHQFLTIEEPLQSLETGQQLIDKREFSPALKPAWHVQVASFRDSGNAERIKRALFDKGFRVYLRSVSLASGSAYHLFVGPEILRSRAEFYAEEISSILGSKTMVDRYAP